LIFQVLLHLHPESRVANLRGALQCHRVGLAHDRPNADLCRQVLRVERLNEFLQPLQYINVIITIGALCLGASQLIFVVNFFWTLIAGPRAERNPWKANTLEWEAPTPPPHGNFPGALPTVYRGPYEYSSPLVEVDYLPQALRLDTQVAGAH
jgi:heme/copper-type cytochrome/quinol oxidase subunit 1